jgi:hypothetical protein
VEPARRAAFRVVVDEIRARRAQLVEKAVALAREGQKLRPDVTDEISQIISEQGRAERPWRPEARWRDEEVAAWALEEKNIGDPRAQAIALEVRRLGGYIAHPVERRKRHTLPRTPPRE